MVQERNVGFGFGFMSLPFKGDEVDIELVKKRWIPLWKMDSPKQEDDTIKSLTPRQVADLLGHSTSQITEFYYVKKDTSRLSGITNDFNL